MPHFNAVAVAAIEARKAAIFLQRRGVGDLSNSTETCMKNLSAAQLKTKERLYKNIYSGQIVLEKAIEKYNNIMKEEFVAVQIAIDFINRAIAEANEFREEIHEKQQSYLDERSDKWSMSEKGMNYEEWKKEWDEMLEEVEVDEPEELTLPEVTAGESLEQLRDELD